MLIKTRDSKQAEIDELTTLLSLPLPANKKFMIERELRFIKSGDKGETDAAYFIDFHFASSNNWAVIHDLRLEHQGRVAQLDHLLINRFFNVYALETKNFSYGVRITDTGEFLVNYNSKYFSIESPIEQNKRHLIVLEGIFDKYDIMPKRLGITMSPTFKSYILVSTKSRVTRPPKEIFDTGMVIKADMLRTEISKQIDNMRPLSVLAAASKMVSGERIKEIAERLSAVHKPITINYRKRFGLEDINPLQDNVAPPVDTQPSKQFYCFQCKKKITGKVAKFCWDNKKQFHGKAYCFDCQKAFQGRP
jgi:hypothetical protein